MSECLTAPANITARFLTFRRTLQVHCSEQTTSHRSNFSRLGIPDEMHSHAAPGRQPRANVSCVPPLALRLTSEIKEERA